MRAGREGRGGTEKDGDPRINEAVVEDMYEEMEAGIAQAQSPQLLYDMIDEVDLLLVIGRRPTWQKRPLVNYAITNCLSTGLFGQLIYGLFWPVDIQANSGC